MTDRLATIRVPRSRQGQTDKGQGGFTSHRFAAAIGEPVTVSLRRPIPLETDLAVVPAALEGGAGWALVDPRVPELPILEAQPWSPVFPSTSAVGLREAETARIAAGVDELDHPAPHCLSCGIGERSLRVHAGPLGDGRWATPFRLPSWAVPGEEDGAGHGVDEAFLWMALDCSCGWYISNSDEERTAVTVRFAVQIHEPLQVDTDYVIVAWNGDHPPAWDGRKRHAAATLFDADGRVVAESTSLWVSV